MLDGIKAVIFDMDGTILDSMWVWKNIDHEFLAKRNIETPHDIQRQIEGLSFNDTAVYFKKAFSLEDEVDDIKDEWLDMVKHYYLETVKLKKGALNYINTLKEKGIKVGLATSNFRELAESALKHNGIYASFDSIVTSCEVEKDKSCPDVFLRTAEELGVNPHECLVFEDTIAGVTGAKRAGMKVFAVYDEYSLPWKDELLKLADRYIQDFEEIA